MIEDTYGVNKIICPYCGYERASEYTDNEAGDTFDGEESQCEKCENFFLLNCDVSVDYIFTTEKDKEDDQ